MSEIELFDILKGYGIKKEDIKKIEIKKDFLEIQLFRNKIKIRDPAIVSLAKFSMLDWNEEHRNYIISKLFTYERIIGKINDPFSFYEEMEEKSLDELKERWEEIKNKLDSTKVKNYVIADICARIKRISRKGVPVGIDRELEKFPFHRLIDMHNFLYSISQINYIDISDDKIVYWT